MDNWEMLEGEITEHMNKLSQIDFGEGDDFEEKFCGFIQELMVAHCEFILRKIHKYRGEEADDYHI